MPDNDRPLLTKHEMSSSLDSMGDKRGSQVDSFAIRRAIHEAQAEEAKRDEAAASRIRELLSAYRLEKARLLGDRIEKRKQLIASQRQRLQELTKPGVSNARQVKEFRLAARREAEALIPPADLRKLLTIRQALAKDLEQASEDDRGLSTAQMLDDKDVPEEIRSPKHNWPVVGQPPFSYYAGTFDYSRLGGQSGHSSFLNPSTGRVGEVQSYHNNDPGDDDYYKSENVSLMGLAVPAPGAAKKWKFWIKVVSAGSTIDFYWIDDWGWSYAYFKFISRLRIMINSSIYGVDVWSRVWEGDDDFNVHDIPLPGGWTKTFVWTTPAAIPNQSAVVFVGERGGVRLMNDDIITLTQTQDVWDVKNVTIELVS